jgi:hypothetical protein
MGTRALGSGHLGVLLTPKDAHIDQVKQDPWCVQDRFIVGRVPHTVSFRQEEWQCPENPGQQLMQHSAGCMSVHGAVRNFFKNGEEIQNWAIRTAFKNAERGYLLRILGY